MTLQNPGLFRCAAALCLVAAPILTGCEFVAKQTYMAAEGIQSRTMEIKRPVGPYGFDSYQAVEVEKFNSRIEQYVPATVTDPVQALVARNVREANFFKEVAFAHDARNTGLPTLVVRGTFIDFHPGAGLNRTIAFGGEGLLTAVVSIIDKETDQVLWMGHCSGFLRATIAGKIAELGEGIGESVQSALQAYHSPIK